jgi:uncharacterized protein (DUF2062 family)
MLPNELAIGISHHTMPRKTLRKFLPHRHQLESYRSLRPLTNLLHDPNLWHLNRHSTSLACGIGLFWSMIPFPFQMFAAAACALLFRVNLPLSVALVWITNPLTMPPIYFATYRLGALLLGEPPITDRFEMSSAWLEELLVHSWQPFILGSLVTGIVLGIAGWLGMRTFWHISVRRSWAQRLRRRRARSDQS